MFPIFARRRLPRYARCSCGRTFSPEKDKETFCSKECAYEDGLRALSGGHSRYRQLFGGRSRYRQKVHHVRCSCGHVFASEDDEETFCSKECAYEDGLRALLGAQSFYREQYSDTRSRAHQALSVDGTFAWMLHTPAVHGKSQKQLHPPSAPAILPDRMTPSRGASIIEFYAESMRHHIKPASACSTHDSSEDYESFAGNSYQAPGPLESHLETTEHDVGKSTSVPPAKAVLLPMGPRKHTPSLPKGYLPFQSLRICARAGAVSVPKGTGPPYTQQGQSILVSANGASLRLPFKSRSLRSAASHGSVPQSFENLADVPESVDAETKASPITDGLRVTRGEGSARTARNSPVWY